MTDPVSDSGVRAAIANELRLLTPAVRRSAAQVESLLHKDFVEFGASGRRWDRAAMLAAIGGELTDDETPEVSEVHGVRLADTVVLLTYLTGQPGRRVRRSSLWRKTDDDVWRLYFHQGTIVSPS
jgi:hypothetical protein